MKPETFRITLRATGLALLALLVFLILRGPATPDGRYVDTKIAASGDVYWEFQDGKVAFS